MKHIFEGISKRIIYPILKSEMTERKSEKNRKSVIMTNKCKQKLKKFFSIKTALGRKIQK